MPVLGEHHDAKDDHSSLVSVCSNDADSTTTFRNAVNSEIPIDESRGALSQAVFIIPPSTSDLSNESQVSTTTAPATLNINLHLGYPVKAAFDETIKEITIVSSSESTDEDTENQPPKRFKSSASFADLMDKGVDFEETDAFDRIRIASAGMEFQGKQNPRLRSDHRPSFGVTIDKTEWYIGGKRACPRGGWLTRMAKEDRGIYSPGSATTTPASGIYRNTDGFTFQC